MLPIGCAAKLQECGEASSGHVWGVFFYNGYVNTIDATYNGFGRFVRRVSPSECQGVTFGQLLKASKRARRRKKPSLNQLNFEYDLGDNLVELEDRINAKMWEPLPTVCFTATTPKAREIHASPYSDRVVHQAVIPILEPIYERRFIDDSYSNRKGKGTHAAVRKLIKFARQLHSGVGKAFYLQLDIRDELKLELKPDIRLRPLTAGIDFLGYVVYPTHTRVRRRVISHARSKLATWGQQHVRPGQKLRLEAAREIAAVYASYEGHFSHANSYRLRRDFHKRFPWLAEVRAA